MECVWRGERSIDNFFLKPSRCVASYVSALKGKQNNMTIEQTLIEPSSCVSTFWVLKVNKTTLNRRFCESERLAVKVKPIFVNLNNHVASTLGKGSRGILAA